jgi:hypothetical protein
MAQAQWNQTSQRLQQRNDINKSNSRRRDDNDWTRLFVETKMEPTNEIKLLCRFCELKNDCSRRQRKSKYEDAGFTTYCTEAKPIRRSREEIEKSRNWKEDGKKNAQRV